MGNPETLEQGQNYSLGLIHGPSVDPKNAKEKAQTVTQVLFSLKEMFLRPGSKGARRRRGVVGRESVISVRKGNEMLWTGRA